jgi:hypothetical protein
MDYLIIVKRGKRVLGAKAIESLDGEEMDKLKKKYPENEYSLFIHIPPANITASELAKIIPSELPLVEEQKEVKEEIQFGDKGG